MGGFSSAQNAIIARLRLDTTDLKAGYAQARSIQSSAQADMLALGAQMQRARGQLESTYTADFRAATQTRISDLRSELAATIGAMQGKSAAEKASLAESAAGIKDQLSAQNAVISNYQALKAQVLDLNSAYREQSATAKEAQAAAVALRSQGIASGQIVNPFTGIQNMLAQMLPGFANIQTRLGGVINAIAILGGGIQGASQGFTGMAESSAGAEKEVGLLGGSAIGLGSALLVGVTAATAMTYGLAKIAIGAGEAAREIQFMSEKTGISVKDLQDFQAIGSTVGLSLQDMVTAQRRFSVAITGQAQVGPDGEPIGTGSTGGSGAGRGPAILKALDIPNKDEVTGTYRDVKDVLLDVSDVFSKMEDGALKSRIAIDLFGRSGLNMIPMLNLGRDGMRQLQDSFDQFMPDISRSADEYKELQIAEEKWTISITALKTSIAEGLLPEIIKLVENLSALAGIKAEGGSILETLMGNSDAKIPGLEDNLTDQIKASGLKGVQVQPGGAARYQQLLTALQNTNQSQTQLGADEYLGIDSPGTAQQNPAIQALLAQAQQQAANRNQTLRTAMGSSGAAPAPNAQEIAIQAMLIEGSAKQVDSANQINATNDKRLKTVADIYAGETKVAEIQEKLFTLAQEIGKESDAEVERKAKLLGLSEQYAAAQKDVLVSEQQMQTALAARDAVYAKLGFKDSTQAQTVLSQVADQGPEAAKGIFQSAGVNYPDAKGPTQQDLAAASALTKTYATAAERHDHDLETIKSITDEFMRQNTELADLDTRENDLLDKRKGSLTIFQQLSKVQEELLQQQLKEADLEDKENGLRQQRTVQQSTGDMGGAVATGKQLTQVEEDRAKVLEYISQLMTQQVDLKKQVAAAPVTNVTSAAEITGTQLDLKMIRPEQAVSQYSSQLSSLESIKASQLDALSTMTAQTAQWKEQLALVNETDKAIKTISDDLKRAGEQQVTQIVEQSNVTTAQVGAKIITPEDATAQYNAQYAALQKIRTADVDNLSGVTQGTDAWNAQLAVINDVDAALTKMGDTIKANTKQTGIGELTTAFESIGSVIGKFSGSVGQQVSSVASSLKETMVALQQLQDEGAKEQGQAPGQSPFGGSGDAGAAIKSLFSGKVSGSNAAAIGLSIMGAMQSGIQAASGSQGAMGILSGALGMGSTGMALGGPLGAGIGAAVGAVSGMVGMLKDKKREQGQDEVTDIQNQVKTIGQNLTLQVIDIKTAITQLQQASAQATAETTTGKKGNSTQMQAVIDSIQSQVVQLQAQEMKILQDFQKQLGMFQVPTGLQNYANTLNQIATTLQQAAGAGASATDQMSFLNDSLTTLTNTVGTDLQTAEKQTFDLMLQSINLTQQRAQIVQSEAQQEQSIMAGLGLTRQLTPAQEAAQQIANLRQSTQLQLQSIDEQQNMLQAQLAGQIELFGWTQQDLTAQDAKAKLLQLQLDLQTQITQQTVAAITSQQQFYNQLLAGQIPALPVGVLPTGPDSGLPVTFTSIPSIALPPVPNLAAVPPSGVLDQSGTSSLIDSGITPTPASSSAQAQVSPFGNNSTQVTIGDSRQILDLPESAVISALNSSFGANTSVPGSVVNGAVVPNGPITVQVNVAGTNVTADQIATAVTAALNKINTGRQQGLQP